MKKFLSIVLAAMMVLSLAACGSKTEAPVASGAETKTEVKDDFKVGMICLHDESMTYDLNFINGIKEACKKLGLSDDQLLIRRLVPEGQECYDAAAELVDQGCKVIFADSFGHDPYMLQAAQDFPEVQFSQATGVLAHVSDAENYHNAFAAIYEGRYLAGVVAGCKLKDMLDKGEVKTAKVGYVGAFPYAEVISGWTSWFLGLQSIVPQATMDVAITGSWGDETLENTAAKTLIDRGCVLLSQHADTYGAPNACEDAGVPNVAYNGSTEQAGPNTYLCYSKIDWAPYYEMAIKAVKEGKTFDTDFAGTVDFGSVKISELSKNCPAGTQEKVDAASKKIASGELKVFDTSKFTVGGKHLDYYEADTDGDYAPDTNVISGGYFHESEVRSAPYFDIIIDGVNVLG